MIDFSLSVNKDGHQDPGSGRQPLQCTLMGDHLRIADTLSILRPVYQTKQSFVKSDTIKLY